MKALRLHAETVQPSGGARSDSASRSFKNPSVCLEEVSLPSPRGEEVLLRVAYCGICGSDFHLAEKSSRDGAIVYPGLVELPVTMGHEFSALVAGYGPKVTAASKKKFPLGSPVTAEEMLWCGKCKACKAGHVNHCEHLEELGFTRDGAHAEYVCVPQKYLWSLKPIAKKFSLEETLKIGALVEPYAVAYRALFHGAHGAPWPKGLRVLVIGAGPIGLACVDLAKHAGAKRVVSVDIDAERRRFAPCCGANLALSPEELAHCAETFDWIVDAAGATKLASETAKRNLAVGGSVCLLARTDEEGSLNSEFLITRNARIFGSQGHSGESTFPTVIRLMAEGKTRARKMIQKIVGIEDALIRLQRQQKCAGKILMQPHQRISP